MKNRALVILLLLPCRQGMASSDSIATKIVTDVQDTFATGMPIALFAAVWWAVANRVPRSWKDLPDPAATFIRTTWKQQGFKGADLVALKEIPSDSLFAKVIMYTQELPHALAVGIPFKKQIEECLEKKEQLTSCLARADVSIEERLEYQKTLQAVELQLNECRFVCGHERVHKEKSHTVRMLAIQFIAPFVAYSFLKHSANALDRHELCPSVSAFLRKGATRSVLEMLIFWASAHWYERQADLHASNDPDVIKAGITLFERAHTYKRPLHTQSDMTKTVLSWVLKYTHPTMDERIRYLKKALK